MPTISDAMYRALCYADVFDFPLTLDEIKKFAILDETKKKISKRKRIVSKQNYFCLQGKEKNIPRRLRLLSEVKNKLFLARKAAGILGLFPTVSAIFVTGGLAVGNAQQQDDIDFMIVTKPGWLWTTRLFVVSFSKLIGKYTHKRATREDATAQDSNTWCLNFWLDETALEVPPAFRNLYTAHEVVQALPLVDKTGVANRFLAANSWVKKFLLVLEAVKPTLSVKKIANTPNPTLIEWLCFGLQRSAVGNPVEYMHAARFFPQDTKVDVLEKYQRHFR